MLDAALVPLFAPLGHRLPPGLHRTRLAQVWVALQWEALCPPSDAAGVYAWQGFGFLYVGVAGCARAGDGQRNAVITRWLEHAMLSQRPAARSGDRLRYRLARRHSPSELTF
eukprot:9605798-Alexandrium_andersonii.AAC.1